MAAIIRDVEQKDFTELHSLMLENAARQDLGVYRLPTVEKLAIDCLKSQPPKFNCLVCEKGDRIVGYAIYSFGYSTWMARVLNIDDFHTQPQCEYEVKYKLLKRLVEIAIEKDCKRTAWTSPALDHNEFWTKQGAVDVTVTEAWHQCRVDKSNFNTLAS